LFSHRFRTMIKKKGGIDTEIDKRRIIISGLVVVIGLCVYAFRVWFGHQENNRAVIESVTEYESETTLPSGSVPEQTFPEKTPVYICGAVADPGIYEVDIPVYLYEVIDLAGGLCETAAPERIDLVYQINGPTSIYIPFSNVDRGEEKRKERDWNDFDEVVSSSWEGEGHNAETKEDAVNINTAGISELCTLPGIGEKTAEAIIAYRQEHGAFAEVKDITGVPGIGTAKYERIKNNISV